jgi:hypothetical protein
MVVMVMVPDVFVPADVVEQHLQELDEFALVEPLECVRRRARPCVDPVHTSSL